MAYPIFSRPQVGSQKEKRGIIKERERQHKGEDMAVQEYFKEGCKKREEKGAKKKKVEAAGFAVVGGAGCQILAGLLQDYVRQNFSRPLELSTCRLFTTSTHITTDLPWYKTSRGQVGTSNCFRYHIGVS